MRNTRAKLRDEIDKIRSMPPMKALSYIWYYYKLGIIGVIVALVLIVYFVSSFLHRDERAMLHVTFVNFYEDVGDNSEFARGVEEYFAEQGIQGEIVFDSGAFFDLSKSSGYNNSYFQKVVASLEADTTDAVICEYDNVMGLAQGGRVLDLSDERAAAIYEKYQDRIVYYEDEDGQQIPVAIDISDSPVWEPMNGYADSCYLMVGFQSQSLEAIECLLDYLLINGTEVN